VEYIIIVTGIFIAVFIRQQFKGIENHLGVNNSSHDDAIDKEVAEAVDSYDRHIDKLTREKKDIPGLDTWAISATPNWEAQLISKAEPLRYLADDAFGSSPDTYHFMQRANQLPMTYNYAHALANFATLTKDLSIKNSERGLKKTQLLGMMRKRDVKLSSIVEAEREIRKVEQESARLEQIYENARRAVVDAVFDGMKEKP
jgi:hypothetical protein